MIGALTPCSASTDKYFCGSAAMRFGAPGTANINGFAVCIDFIGAAHCFERLIHDGTFLLCCNEWRVFGCNLENPCADLLGAGRYRGCLQVAID